MEKRQLEAHLIRTEVWAEHLGKWRAIVQSVEVPDDKEPPQFMILVEVEENLGRSNDNICIDHRLTNEKNEMDNISTGWVVLRSLTEFHVRKQFYATKISEPKQIGACILIYRNYIVSCDHYVRISVI